MADLATTLGRLGDTDTFDVRRARAAGLLASPQTALDLLSGAATDPDAVRGGSVELVVHVTPDHLAGDGPGATSVEHLGAVTTELLAAWVRRALGPDGRLHVRPVLEVSSAGAPSAPERAVDAHDPPGWMRESVVVRDATCVFPGCRRDSRRADLDHVERYLPAALGGASHQTRPSNLAPLCRTHDRAKTFTRWRYRRLPDGSYRWTSPTGHTYVSRSHGRRPPGPAGR